jgi:hypothetical protein
MSNTPGFTYDIYNIPAEAPCAYCGEMLRREADPETGAATIPTHWECVWEAPAGTFYVRTVQHAATPAREAIRRFTTRKRAVEVAEQIRRHNPRTWACGASLDIFVGEYQHQG